MARYSLASSVFTMAADDIVRSAPDLYELLAVTRKDAEHLGYAVNAVAKAAVLGLFRDFHIDQAEAERIIKADIGALKAASPQLSEKSAKSHMLVMWCLGGALLGNQHSKVALAVAITHADRHEGQHDVHAYSYAAELKSVLTENCPPGYFMDIQFDREVFDFVRQKVLNNALTP